ncbi:MAG TPA: hypothetical protein VGF28_11720 [Thermoanaerobaculia bacterium]|jgi:hypothetical protein
MIVLDSATAVVVCAGPSLDRLTPAAWSDLAQAGAIVSVNGAAASLACAASGVRFTCLAAMDLSTGLATHVPPLTALWRDTTAWRVASTDSRGIDAESYIVEVDEEHGVEGWSDDRRQGYKGGSTGMVVGNWLGNAWPDDDLAQLQELEARTGRTAPRRGFKRLAYVGLDMHRGHGVHARGAGNHTSGFASSDTRYGNVCRGWEKFCNEAARRGIEVVNCTPGTGLEAMPRADVPEAWVS